MINNYDGAHSGSPYILLHGCIGHATMGCMPDVELHGPGCMDY